ncbi:MAG: recombinase family protein [Aestuariivirga sp.]|uniref:recombinase family protein n=1 Tax=Aestuariivirga sp. TaxID=2650926 RepID=UPI0025BD6138|nr:recombinase family protein [Aestuariivirga sp.]MCA3559892.1 recombinase family protein [Aestuariivirga sp.]
MAGTTLKRSRCAIYTRKSSEEGLDMEFNSLEAQREACEAYVASQKAEGWVAIRDRYDDGGFSGGTLERPALKRLIADIEAGLIDVIVVYKIDRLSRSLMDFAKLVEVFDRNNVTFVSVTQSFNTTTSMGRLTLNILLSFAQFEREVIGERIRDKFAASRKRGMWMGGFVPMGYDVKDRKLVVNEAEAVTVRMIFERFAALGSASTLARALQAEDVRNKRGKRIDKGFIYKLINSRVYLGEAVHKGTSYPGEHDAIITQELWDRVHAILKESPRERRAKNRNSSEALLKGIIFTDTGAAMTPTYTRKGERLYHYYTSMDLIRNRDARGGDGPMRLAAAMVDGAVITEMRRIIGAPEIAARVIESQRRDGGPMDERAIVAALQRFNDLWDALYPAEQTRIVRLLVDRVTVGPSGMAVDLRNNGIATLVREIGEIVHLEAAE